ncbi:MAG: cobyrinate a,c-diamide synthase, partial [Gammaproteobacteria bacterium]|nr:cobyrinate a,c-diamide synthase [Gammaproteobacteria bacterium]
MNPSEDSNTCSIILLAAPASNQGKTTLTAAITRYYRNQGLRVIVFKAGPDFLDPMIHEAASGQAVYSLDTWMVGETDCQRLLAQAAKHADIIFIECGMGLFDGSPSSADLARLFNVPILLIVDASSMAQTFGAIVYGLTHYQEDLQFLGVIANRVASERHQSLLQQSLKPEMKLIASIPRDQSFSLPSRHLGLVQAEEIHHLDQQLDQMGQILHEIDFDLPRPDIQFEAVHSVSLSKLLNGVRIAIAKDLAFKFIYPANLDCLNELGAELLFFSPLNDKTLPDADAIWIPGGYPELFMQQLSANTSMKDSIKAHYDMNKPLLAEC